MEVYRGVGFALKKKKKEGKSCFIYRTVPYNNNYFSRFI